MTYADKVKRKMELRRKRYARIIANIEQQDAKRMYLAAACTDILWRMRMRRHSAGMLK